MECISKIEIRGKVKRIEVKRKNNTTLANMTVMTEVLYNIDGQPRAENTFHTVEAWENTQVKDLTKIQVGSWVRVMGRYKTKKFEKDGKTQYYMMIYTDYLKKLPDNTTEYVNKVEITGIVTKIDINIIRNKTVGKLTVATDYVYRSKGEKVVETTHHLVEGTDSPKIKDLAKISPGTMVKVTGRYRKIAWTDKNTGEKRSMWQILAEQIKKIAE